VASLLLGSLSIRDEEFIYADAGYQSNATRPERACKTTAFRMIKPAVRPSEDSAAWHFQKQMQDQCDGIPNASVVGPAPVAINSRLEGNIDLKT